MATPTANGASPHTDSDRFESLYRAHYARVLAYALRRAPAEVAYDAVAETFLVAWRRLNEVPAAPLPWLLCIARKTLANQRRAARRQQALVGVIEAQARVSARGETDGDDGRAGALADAVARLPRNDQELLKLVVWDELSLKEAAHVMGWTHVACRVRWHRARRRLALAVADQPDVAVERPTHHLQPTMEETK